MLSGLLKRKPALLAQAMKEQGASAEESAIVGDTYLDIEAGKVNGVRTIGVTWGYGTREEMEKAGADEIKSEPLEI
jgi:phosphoglycolate phosphatase